MRKSVTNPEVDAQLKVEKRLDKRLNRVLDLPRKTEHEWDLVTFEEASPSWESFYKGYLGQVALTSIDSNVIQTQLRWPAQSAGFSNPPAFRPQAFFRLVGFPTTPEELVQHRYDYPGFINIGLAFSNLAEYQQLSEQVTHTAPEFPEL